MITIKELRWTNCFSYGANNVINFVKAPLTQLVGKNGHGKSSVALILEEVLFNKNSKNIKKADILNRYVKEKSYIIELDLERDNNEYTIKCTRGTQQTVKLLKNGVDISAHTATQTYKIIEEIIGIDHKSFAQIVYQSNASSLEFLTSADTARKKFLIEILNLTKYTRAGEIFKEYTIELGKQISECQGKITAINSWLDKYEKSDLTPRQLQKVEVLDSTLPTQVAQLELEILNVDKTNRKINQNNTYIKQLDNLNPIIEIRPINYSKLKDAQQQQTECMKTVRDGEAFIKRLNNLHGICPTCFSKIDENKVSELVHIKMHEIESARAEAVANLIVANDLESQDTKYKQAKQIEQEFEKLILLIDKSLTTNILDKNELQVQYNELSKNLQNTQQRIKLAEEYNNKAQQHNSRIDAIKQQLQEMNIELA